MKVTVDLDDDIAARLDELSRERKSSLHEVVNSLLRSVLRDEAHPAAPGRRRFSVAPVNLGKPRLANVDDVSSVIDFAERLDAGEG